MAYPRASSRAATLIGAYSVCSSTMLVVNKVAVRELPIPALVRCGCCLPWRGGSALPVDLNSAPP